MSGDAITTSSTPIRLARVRRAGPCNASRSCSGYRGAVFQGRACVIWREKPHLCGMVAQPKRRGRDNDNEHVYRHRVSQVVVQKAASSRGGGLGAQRRIPPDCRRTAVFSAPSDAVLSTMAVAANRTLERSNRFNWPFDRSSMPEMGLTRTKVSG